MSLKYEDVDQVVNLTIRNYNLKKIRCNINDLKFNPYNDRFAIDFYAYEFNNKRPLGLDDASQEKIFDLLLSNKKRTSITMKDIINNGVLKEIVVDKKGIILDGNRRIAILRKIIQNAIKTPIGKQLANFERPHVILLNEELEESKIRDIETILQISEDEKLNYDPINLYLKINRLYEMRQRNNPNAKKEQIFGEVANLMGAKYDSKSIKTSQDVFLVMKKYLRFIQKPDQYVYLKKKEDHFKHIKNFLISANKKTINFNNLSHKNHEENIDDIEEILFQLTAVHVEGKLFRNIVPNARSTKSPLLSNLGFEKIENFITQNFIKDNKIELKNDSNLKMDLALNKIINRYSSQQETNNHIAETNDFFKKIDNLIARIDKWNASLRTPYVKDKIFIAKVYEFINKLKSIQKDYEENADD